jgi:hypothetical protein
MSEPRDLPESDPTIPDDRRDDPPLPGSAWVEEHAPPASEAERQAQETVRSVSRLDESN